MNPDEFNELVAVLEAALNDHPSIGTVQVGQPADDTGAAPELYVDVNGVDLALIVTPL